MHPLRVLLLATLAPRLLVLEAKADRTDQELVAIPKRRLGDLARTDIRSAPAVEIANLIGPVRDLDDRGE